MAHSDGMLTAQDDDELEQIRQDYRSGKLLTGEIKKRYAAAHFQALDRADSS